MSVELPRGTLYSPPEDSPPLSPTWNRPGRRPRSSSSTSVTSVSSNLIATVWKLQRHAKQYWKKLSLWQKIIGSTLLIIMNVAILLGVIYHEAIFHWFVPIANQWREIPFGFMILFMWTFFSAFPPLIGYSTSVTLAGFVYGLPNGWYIAASGTVVGSTAAFIACRVYFRNFAQKMVQTDKRFAALSLTLKHDGLKLLCMIRLCPLPYSISNAALSTFPTISWVNFAIAGAVASPKLFIHVFIGHQMKVLGERGEKMPAGTKALNYGSMIGGAILGFVTGWIIYRRTVTRAQELENEERRRVEGRESTELERSRGGEQREQREGYFDDPIEEQLERTLSGGGNSGGRRDGYADEEDGRGSKKGIAGRALGVFNELFGRTAVDDGFDSEREEQGRLLAGDELMDDEDAEELLVVEDDPLELGDGGRGHSRGRHGGSGSSQGSER
ncbi:Tlg2-vesicle protein [Orbilia ellipsospora]|uniref:Golgi apparatus membrane protein TVP38 n=1 Tax=Orbilia ellipsospora TaxID=2528407 RepID=A0AAV9X124_9PEZI